MPLHDLMQTNAECSIAPLEQALDPESLPHETIVGPGEPPEASLRRYIQRKTLNSKKRGRTMTNAIVSTLDTADRVVNGPRGGDEPWDRLVNGPRKADEQADRLVNGPHAADKEADRLVNGPRAADDEGDRLVNGPHEDEAWERAA